MAARRDTGLSADQVMQLRSAVEAGRAKRVVVTGPQFPAGTTGTVVRVGSADVDGDDFIAVRVRVGGVVDELGFAPTELSLSSRGRTKTVAAAPPVADKPSPARRKPSTPRRQPTTAEPAAPAPASAPTPAAAPPKRTGRSSRRGASATPVTVTIASVGATWTVSAHRGQRVVLKNAAVSPGIVAAVVALLGQPPIDEAVAAVNDTARIEAETRAEQLRAELAQVEAVLNSHRRP
jgi:hypothetical protein